MKVHISDLNRHYGYCPGTKFFYVLDGGGKKITNKIAPARKTPDIPTIIIVFLEFTPVKTCRHKKMRVLCAFVS
ncbi:MAG: hypothetical protein UX72_C0017G0048 [Parcubacteria group bacterium GW2011_GWA2_47_10]|nr:MAG: hypothetical protein UX72_C0017G0048 [Parcubacteria group bacterium GW2011_GWA2_47_10]